MSTRSFELTTSVPVAPEEAIDFLLRLDAHRGMHPYLQSARVVGEGEDAGVRWQAWEVVERPPLGPFRYTLRFPARMSRLAPTRMRGDVHAAPGCDLVTTTDAVAADGGAVVTERTVVTAPWAVVGYMTRHARLAHARTFGLLAGELARTR